MELIQNFWSAKYKIQNKKKKKHCVKKLPFGTFITTLEQLVT